MHSRICLGHRLLQEAVNDVVGILCRRYRSGLDSASTQARVLPGVRYVHPELQIAKSSVIVIVT